MTTYRKHRRASVAWVLAGIGGLVAVYATMFALIGSGLFRQLGDWGAVVGVMPLVVGMGLGWFLMARITKRRVGDLAAWLRSQGYDVVERPTPAQRQEFARDIAALFRPIGLARSEEAIQWCAVQGGGAGAGAGAGALKIFEHEYVTGSGKFTQVHARTALFWPAGHLDLPRTPLATAAWVSAARLPWLIRRTVQSHELVLPELAEFTRAWTLLGSAETARRFLTPPVVAQLQAAPKDEEWGVGANWVCCSFRGPLDAENLGNFIAHAREVLKAADAGAKAAPAADFRKAGSEME